MLKCLQRKDEDEEEEQATTAPTSRKASWEVELPGTGLRRDRTHSFAGIRRARALAASPVHQRGGCSGFHVGHPLPEGAGEDAEQQNLDDRSAKLRKTYEEATHVRASLASKLAQHRGLMQFSADFVHRAPPLELRMLLTPLEASIREQLKRLGALSEELSSFDLPGTEQSTQLKANLRSFFETSSVEAEEAFGAQQSRIRQQAALSPHYSPVICPITGAKLAKGFARSPPRSPPLAARSVTSTASPGTATTASPGTPPRTPAELLLPPAAKREEGDDDEGSHTQPFSSLFSVHMVTEEMPLVQRRDRDLWTL